MTNSRVRVVQIDTDDGPIEARIRGEGPSVILLPSLGRGACDFDEITFLMAGFGIQTICPQPRGIGGSALPGRPYDMLDLAQDIVHVVEATSERPALIAGHAFGNFVARSVASFFPSSVRGIALVAASPGRVPGEASPYDPEVIDAVYRCSDVSLPRQERLRLLQLAFFAEGNDPSVWLQGWYPEAKQLQRKAQTLTPVDAFFAAGTVPILDLQATQDTVAPRKHSHVLASALGDRVTIELIDGAGHALLPEQPVAVAKALTRWVQGMLPIQGS
jgi:pimeloyl-ACP methyl ester carboxylesterase